MCSSMYLPSRLGPLALILWSCTINHVRIVFLNRRLISSIQLQTHMALELYLPLYCHSETNWLFMGHEQWPTGLPTHLKYTWNVGSELTFTRTHILLGNFKKSAFKHLCITKNARHIVSSVENLRRRLHSQISCIHTSYGSFQIHCISHAVSSATKPYMMMINGKLNLTPTCFNTITGSVEPRKVLKILHMCWCLRYKNMPWLRDKVVFHLCLKYPGLYSMAYSSGFHSGSSGAGAVLPSWHSK